MGEVKSKQYIDVRLGMDLYGIEIEYIDNIIVMQNITRVPKSQPYFLGVINLRGEVVPVMSLRLKLGLEEAEFTSATRIIIVKPDPQAASIGIIVDEVNEVINLKDDDIEHIKYDDKDGKKAFSKGLGKLGSDLVILLDIPELVIEAED